MTHHGIRITDHYARLLWRGVKTAELRIDDRDYQIGDLVTFYDMNDKPSWMLDEPRTITHVLKNYPGLEPGYVVLSLNNPEFDYFQRMAKERYEEIERLYRSNAALRGQITKLRKRLGAAKSDVAFLVGSECGCENCVENGCH